MVYTTPIPNSDEKEEAANLFVDNTGIAISAEIPIDLVQHGTLTRFAVITDSSGQLQEDRRSYPAISTGSITFDRFSLNQGETVSGQFEIIFISGDTLLGDFSAPVEIGDLGDL